MSANSRCGCLLSQIVLEWDLLGRDSWRAALLDVPYFGFGDAGGHLVFDDETPLLLGDVAVYADPNHRGDLQFCQSHRPRPCFRLACRRGSSTPTTAVRVPPFPLPPMSIDVYLYLPPIALVHRDVWVVEDADLEVLHVASCSSCEIHLRWVEGQIFQACLAQGFDLLSFCGEFQGHVVLEVVVNGQDHRGRAAVEGLRGID